MRLLRTSTFRITLLYAVMLAISTAAVALFLYWSTIGFLQRQTDQAIEIEIAGLREAYRSQGLNGLSRIIGDRIRGGDDPEAIYLFADRKLRPLAGNLEAWPLLVATEEGWYSFQLESGGQRTMARARVLQLRQDLVLLVGRDISDLNRLLTLAGGALFWSAGLVIAFALAGGVFMSRRLLGRIEGINDTTRSIMSGDFSQRVVTRGTGDEYDKLAENLNLMLERIEALMSDMRHVGDSIAHDLRTPLTRLRQALEATATSDDINEMRSGISAAVDDTDRLLSTFAALLRIARLESGGIRIRSDPLNLSDVVRDALELYSVIADERHIEIETELATDANIPGDRDLIFQLVVNLLDNAIKYTPEHGRIEAKVVAGPDDVTLSMADSGPGIPEDQLEKVTNRFYRVDTSRQHAGSGLGLSLVRAIAEHHGAELHLTNQQHGLRAEVRFPGAR
jgi:signal transduction histidine kinase